MIPALELLCEEAIRAALTQQAGKPAVLTEQREQLVVR